MLCEALLHYVCFAVPQLLMLGTLSRNVNSSLLEAARILLVIAYFSYIVLTARALLVRYHTHHSSILRRNGHPLHTHNSHTCTHDTHTHTHTHTHTRARRIARFEQWLRFAFSRM